MEITALDTSSLRIKSKRASLVVDPKTGMPKVSADAVVLLGEADISRVTDARVTIENPGEYEVGGIKITAETFGDGVMYNLNVDNIIILLAKTSTIEKTSDTLSETQIAVLNVDSDINESSITALEARVVLLYGEKAQEALKILGKQGTESTKKIAFTSDKLPEETQIVWLR